MSDRRDRLRKVLADLVDGSYPVVLGCREVATLASGMDIERRFLDLFVMVDSETESLHIGPEAMLWSEDERRSSAAKADRYGEVVRGEVVAAARQLLQELEERDPSLRG